MFEPIQQESDSLREYTDEEVARFLSEDKLSPEVASRVRELLRREEHRSAREVGMGK